VFIHGIAVIEVTDYQRVDSAKFRKERHQQTQPVHGSQGSRGVRQTQYETESTPQGLRLRTRPAGGSRELPFNPLLRFLAELQVMTGYHFEKAENQRWVFQCRVRLAGENPASHDRKIDIGEARSPVLKHTVERTARRQ